MRFIYDDEFRALFHEDIPANIRLDEVNADDLKGIVIVDTRVTLDSAVKTSLSIRPNNDRLNVQLGADLRVFSARVRDAM